AMRPVGIQFAQAKSMRPASHRVAAFERYDRHIEAWLHWQQVDEVRLVGGGKLAPGIGINQEVGLWKFGEFRGDEEWLPKVVANIGSGQQVFAMLFPELGISVPQHHEASACDRAEDAGLCGLTRKPRGGAAEIRRAIAKRQKMHERHRDAL